MPTLKQIYAISGDTTQAQYDAINQAAFDLIDASGVTWPGARRTSIGTVCARIIGCRCRRRATRP